MLNAPVFLLGSHKSGSSLLRSLLDGHPALFVVPAEMHFFQRTGYWVQYPLRRSAPRQMNREEVIASLVHGIDRKNRGAGALYGDGDLTGRLDLSTFRSNLEAASFNSAREAFEAYATALHAAIVGSPLPPERRVVEKSVENAEYASALRQMFPDCRFVHIVRNPYASLVAIRRSRIKTRYAGLADAVLSLQNCYYNLYRNEQTLDRYLIISYENLVRDVRGTMADVASFLSISFEEILLRPTSLGEPWGGNSSSNDKFAGVTTAALERWMAEITDLEIHLVNAALQPVLRRFGYQQRTPKRHWLAPVPGEGVGVYTKNRSLFWFL